MSDPFDIGNAYTDNDRFNPEHPNISRVYANVNLDMGPAHWSYRTWNPDFGDINRYTLEEWVGRGQFSDVFVALRDNTERVAIKVLKPVNNDRVRRELKVLSVIQGHESILNLIDIVIDSKEGVPSMVTEYVPSADWHDLFTNMKLDDCKFYLYRVLQALDYTHQRGIMHRDVKPLNILCQNPREGVKLADWGLAEFYHPMRTYSPRVATRYYKSPEILLGYEYYDYSLDIWGAGVMLLEILTQRLHAFKGHSDHELLCAIVEVVGGAAVVNWADKYRVKIPHADRQRFLKCPGQSLASMLTPEFNDPDALDLVTKMLAVDHKERITAAEALAHPFFQLVRDEDEKKCV